MRFYSTWRLSGEALLAFCNWHKPCGIWRRERNLLNTSAVTPTVTVDSRTIERKTQHSSDWEQSCDTEDDRGRKAIGQSSSSDSSTRNKESGTITEKQHLCRQFQLPTFTVGRYSCVFLPFSTIQAINSKVFHYIGIGRNYPRLSNLIEASIAWLVELVKL